MITVLEQRHSGAGGGLCRLPFGISWWWWPVVVAFRVKMAWWWWWWPRRSPGHIGYRTFACRVFAWLGWWLFLLLLFPWPFVAVFMLFIQD